MNIRAEIFGGGREQRRLLKDKAPKQTEAKGLANVAISREETRRSNSRDGDRYRLVGAVHQVRYHGRPYDAEVVNLSGGGAMIAADLLPNIGESIHLELGEGAPLECAVRWIKGGRLGLEFAHETQLQCNDDERSTLLRDVISREFPDEKFAHPAPEQKQAPAEDFDNNRSAVRHPLIWTGELIHGSNSWRVRLRNISATGALVECPGSLRIDSEVLLDLHKAGEVPASVCWVVGDHIGLRFDHPFDMQRLSHEKPTVTPAQWLRPAYLAGEAETNGPWDQTWSRMSMDDLRNQLEGFLKR